MISFNNISIIIPVGPDENLLEKLLDDLHLVKEETEIIIVNGSHRAKQLNEGARKATRDFLWFLHADSQLDGTAFEALLTLITNDRLNSFDIVIGPAKDGGYYLIGCKRIYLELFLNIEWSTNRVFSQTLEAANLLHLKVSLLRELNDIDSMEDLCKLKSII